MPLHDNDGLTYEGGLFDVDVNPKLEAPTPAKKMSGTALHHRKVARRIGAGEHPLGQGIRLHPDAPRDLDYQEARRSTADGPRCGSCRFRVPVGHYDKSYPKCYLPTVIGGRETYPRATRSDASDVAAWWPGCLSWKGVE